MTERVNLHGYQVNSQLYHFINQDVLPGTGIEESAFWQSFADIFNQFAPRNRALLAKRETFQQTIDAWHLDGANKPLDAAKYKQFLTEIGYIVPEPAAFSVTTANVDPEVATVAGPQLVVPLMNARYALNAANARWGSLYDALYGTDVIPPSDGAEITKGYNPKRGALVIQYARDLLDRAIPLAAGSHCDAAKYAVVGQQLAVTLTDGQVTGLADPSKFVGYQGDSAAPSAVLCRDNGLHLAIQMDTNHPIGKDDKAGVKDVVLEAALSTIQDCEDSIAAVDGADKTAVYRNWLGLMKGDLAETLEKNGKQITRTLHADHRYTAADGSELVLKGRSLQFIRNVGHLMTNDAVLDDAGNEMPEGILDGIVTSCISLHDLKQTGPHRNSVTGSIYIVKPKMHGPEEVLMTCDLFSAIEDALGVARNTIKVGIMDEERRTSINLKACIEVAKERVAFINTGFLDRTGDEIHTSMQAGPVVRKELMKNEKWISSYEARNVNIGLAAGLKGKAQIGKGMWAEPDNMAAMMVAKQGHPKAGANCAWVPSPTAATLHAIHYHDINVSQVQDAIIAAEDTTRLDDLITIPLLADPGSLTAEQIKQELDNNVQGLLGYVVRWVDQGVGCSKVPDIHNVGKMEDRATLRISSQHICNWLHHGILTQAQVMESLQRMAAVVDGQNAGDAHYLNMAPNFDQSIAFEAAKDLIFKGKEQPSGYTEPLLHQSRVRVKAR